MNRIKDIAKKANVSAGTVDRVIHNRGGVSEKTRVKILKIIEENNYTVNPIASILASKKKFTIATLLPRATSNNDFWQSPKEGVIASADEIHSLGIDVLHFEFDQFRPESYIEAFYKLLESDPSAVLLAPVLHKETIEIIHLLDQKKIPYVTINAETEGLNNLSYIGQNSYKGGYLAGKLMNWVLPPNATILIVEIRKNIDNHKAITNRIKGFKAYFDEHKKKKSIQHITIDQLDNENFVNQSLATFLEEYPQTKGIFVPSSKAHHIAKSIQILKRKDIEIGGFDTTPQNIDFLKNEHIDFLISQKPYQQGYEGIKLLFNYLIHKKEPLKNYFLPIEIVLKENVDYH
ncbi:LacI family DNA-binding transcriptional regulator [Ochrovirga pacifica]|uniref:LacI family DNA-binding transcriptional regulator n=1 Tax=Ochrovirga pacifica TaxID=1042376 RepID=UPI0002559852|nr:substrate-binding domain-containing protein [Ochrovirga pacifica]